MLNPNRFENSRPDGFPVLEIVPEDPAHPVRLFVPLQRTVLAGTVSGPLVDLTFTQIFSFSRDLQDRPIEALYRFPLPGDAAVTGVSIHFGEVEIAAELKPRVKAEEEYEQAKNEGRQAALTTRESPDVFTIRVAGIDPDQPVRVETRFVQVARPEGAGWSLRIPLTTSPRYVREDEAHSRHAEGQPLALLRDPGHRFALDLQIEAAGNVASPTHSLETDSDGSSTRVRLRDGEVIPDRDCLIRWTPISEKSQPTAKLFTHTDKSANQLYFLAQVSPSTNGGAKPPVAREVILVVDHSGSMEGPKWAAADWAVERFLRSLSAGDRFNVCLFHSDTRWFRQGTVSGGEAEIQAAVDFLKKHRDSGGTNLGVALEQAVHQPRTGGEMARHVLVVTDAEVSDDGRILRLARDEYARPDRRRISVLCIDAAPNALLANQLAEQGGGVSRFLTSSPAAEDVTTALDEILDDWAAPELVDLKLELNRPVADASGRRSSASWREGWTAIDLGDLPLGRSVWVAGRCGLEGRESLAYRITSGRREIAFGDFPGEGADHTAIRPLFGARRVLALEQLAGGYFDSAALSEELKRLGYDPDRILARKGHSRVYAENVMEETRDTLKQLLVAESLEFGIASSEAAFVATRVEKGQKVSESVVVANALPDGWSDRFAGGAMLCSLAAAPAYAVGSAPPSQGYGAMGDSLQASFGDMFRGRSKRAVATRHLREDYDDLTTSTKPGGGTVFSGVPAMANGEAVLFDTQAKSTSALPDRSVLTELRVSFRSGYSPTPDIGAGLSILIYVDDMVSPRARIRLSDLARQGWKRPLNISRRAGERVWIVLSDPGGVWASGAPEMEVVLS